MMTVKRTRQSVLTLSLVVACAVIGLGGLVAYAAQSAVPLTNGVDSLAPSHMLWGGRHVTIESPNGDIISYDNEGNVQPGRPKGSDTPQELTYEQVLERIRMHEEKGLPVPEAYLDMVRQAE